MNGFHFERRRMHGVDRACVRSALGWSRFTAFLLLVAGGWFSSSDARASTSGPAPALVEMNRPISERPRHGAVATELVLTRYGTSHETINVLESISSFDVGIAYGIAVFGVLPLSVSYMDRNACCGRSLGNMTGGVRHRSGRDSRWLEFAASVSAPTAPGDGDAGVQTRFAATAAVGRDAGLYLPDVTTVRLALRASTELGHRAWLTAGAAAHTWISQNLGQPSQLLLPVAATVGRQLSSKSFGFIGITTILSLLHREDRLLTSTNAGVGYQASRVTISARLNVPLDGSLRSLGMIGLGTDLQVSF